MCVHKDWKCKLLRCTECECVENKNKKEERTTKITVQTCQQSRHRVKVGCVESRGVVGKVCNKNKGPARLRQGTCSTHINSISLIHSDIQEYCMF